MRGFSQIFFGDAGFFTFVFIKGRDISSVGFPRGRDFTKKVEKKWKSPGGSWFTIYLNHTLYLAAAATWRVNMYNAKQQFILHGCSVMEITIDFCARGRSSSPPLIWRKILRLENAWNLPTKIDFPETCYFCELNDLETFWSFGDFFMSYLSHPEKVFFSSGSGSFWLGSDPELFLGSGSTSRAFFGLRINLRINFAVWLR